MTNDLNDHFFRPLALLACGGVKDNRDNRDNPFLLPVPACKQRKKIVPIVSIVFKPPQAKAALALDVVACQSKKRAIIAC